MWVVSHEVTKPMFMFMWNGSVMQLKPVEGQREAGPSGLLTFHVGRFVNALWHFLLVVVISG